MKFNKKYLFLVLVFLFILLISQIINIITPNNILNSPDEVSDYRIMKEYALTGNMYINASHLSYDLGNNLHPRGLLTWNNALVPFDFLGFPFFYGPLYNFFGENLKYILVGIDVLILLFILYSLYSLFYDEKMKLYLISLFVLLTPILFYLNFFYFSITGNVIFFFLFFLYLKKFNQTKNKKDLYLSTLFASIAVFFRYESILFILILFTIDVFTNLKLYKNLNKKTVMFLKLLSISI
ncbi:MAG: hypothetical protein AABX29_05140, partial [Nanoarchaeota archaeon]